LQSQVATEEDKRKMMQILLRHYQEQQTKEDHSSDSEEDISGDEQLREDTDRLLAHIDNLQLEDLTAEQQKQFFRAVASGQLSQYLELKQPWWMQRTPGITVLDSRSSNELSDSNDANHVSNIAPVPPIILNIPPLSSISKQPPASSILKLNVIELLFSYAYVWRLFNGDLEDSLDILREVVDTILALSHQVLVKNVNHQTWSLLMQHLLLQAPKQVHILL
jgi:hypothetical protein